MPKKITIALTLDADDMPEMYEAFAAMASCRGVIATNFGARAEAEVERALKTSSDTVDEQPKGAAFVYRDPWRACAGIGPTHLQSIARVTVLGGKAEALAELRRRLVALIADVDAVEIES